MSLAKLLSTHPAYSDLGELTFAVSQLLQCLLVSEGELVVSVYTPLYSSPFHLRPYLNDILRSSSTQPLCLDYILNFIHPSLENFPHSTTLNPPNHTFNPKQRPTFPDLTTNCSLELIDSEFFADLDFLTGAIVAEFCRID